MMIWQKVKDFWIRSYTSDRTAFYYETTTRACVFVSMTWISVTADAPPMHLIYPVSFTGAVFSIIAFVRRQVGWSWSNLLCFLTCIWIWQSNGVVVMSGQRRFLKMWARTQEWPKQESMTKTSLLFLSIFPNRCPRRLC